MNLGARIYQLQGLTDIWTGDASLAFFDHPTLELADLRPTRVIAGYRFSFAFTVDDLVHAEDFTTHT